MRYWLMILACGVGFVSTAQINKKVATYLTVQCNATLYDETKPNNQAGLGIGLQAVFNHTMIWKPVVELTADAYLLDDKVLRMKRITDSTFQSIETANEMLTFSGGVLFHPKMPVFFSVTAGGAVVNQQLLPMLRTSAGCYFSENRRWLVKLGYSNIFNRYKPNRHDFGAITLLVGVKLF